jgi:hypothetical protein
MPLLLLLLLLVLLVLLVLPLLLTRHRCFRACMCADVCCHATIPRPDN